MWSGHFNSHTREGVTYTLPLLQVGLYNFNSHTREGVTDIEKYVNPSAQISTHTPVRVWRFTLYSLICLAVKFQLTHPWGCDNEQIQNYDTLNQISTHTPVRVWLFLYSQTMKQCKFQLTHPWGCDLPWQNHIPDILYFNSHTREGVTLLNTHMELTF